MWKLLGCDCRSCACLSLAARVWQQTLWFVLTRSSCCHKGARQAWLRSPHTGSFLPSMLRGKAPCIWAEIAGERSQCVSLIVGGDVLCRATALGRCCSQKHSHAVSARRGRQLNGAHSPYCILSCCLFLLSLVALSLFLVASRCFAHSANPLRLTVRLDGGTGWMGGRVDRHKRTLCGSSVDCQPANKSTGITLLFPFIIYKFESPTGSEHRRAGRVS